MHPQAAERSWMPPLPEHIRNDLGGVFAGRLADFAALRNDSEPPEDTPPDAGLKEFSHRETKGDERVAEVVAGPAGSFGDVG
ncbi:hypothetical protein ACFY05_43270, partial [Microtetraspora fusca]